MNSKDTILSRIRENTRKKYDYPAWDIKATVYPDAVTQFCTSLQASGGKAVFLAGNEDVDEVIRRHYPSATRIASNLKDIGCAAFNPDDVTDARDLDGTDVAVVEGQFGVAENGAVWIPQAVKHKLLYFISESLVIIIRRADVVNNMHEAYARLAGQEYPFGVFISGPSKTADIEQALVFGAHGPRDVLVILK